MTNRRILCGALLPALVASTACTGVPRLRADYVGLAHLLVRRSDRQRQPDAVELPNLSSYRQGGSDALGDGHPGGTAPTLRPPYLVGVHDELVVLVWGRRDLGSQVPVDLNGELRASVVRPDGTIFLPFLGDVQVAGRTPEGIRSLVAARYAQLVENPQVEVDLRECRSQAVALGGAVAQPGVHYLCAERQTLGEMLTSAKGLTESADPSRGSLTREGTTYALDLREAERGQSHAAEVLLRDGDTIHFPAITERVVHVYGEVERQGSVPIPPEGLNVLDALGQARGLDNIAGDSRRIFLVRHTERGVLTYKLKLSELMTGPRVELVDGDTLFVPPNKLESWDRWWRRVLPFTGVRTKVRVGNP